jgi:hypothetical protein
VQTYKIAIFHDGTSGGATEGRGQNDGGTEACGKAMEELDDGDVLESEHGLDSQLMARRANQNAAWRLPCISTKSQTSFSNVRPQLDKCGAVC